jgi:GT2 family glycosyltransferase
VDDVRRAGDGRVAVVMMTWNRRTEALSAVDRLLTLPEQPRVVVVDNGSDDGTADAVRRRYEGDGRIELIALRRNEGAVARNIGVRHVQARYVAFCDDDTWWDPGALAAAADVLDRHPGLAVVTGTIVVEPGARDDPVNDELRHSPVQGPAWLPGPALGSFLAGASVLRRDAFESVGGFSRRLWLGGEEELLAADLAARGWELCHLPAVVVHHRASAQRDPHLRRRLGLRNTLWFTWLRRPLRPALRRTVVLLSTVPRDLSSLRAVLDALAGLPWVLRERSVLPAHVEARFAALDASQAASRARRYVS